VAYTGRMHQRTWLSILTFPLVAAFTYPMVVRHSDPPRKESKPANQDPLAGLSDIQDVLALVREHYVDAPDMGKVIAGGIQGTLERAHPLNAYLSPEDLRLPDPGSADPGLKLRKSQIYAQVIAVHPNGPAAKAGVHVGDIIRKLDGQSLGPMSAWTVERSLRGIEGSEVTMLWYDGMAGTTKKLTLKRGKNSRLAIGIRKEPTASVVTLHDLEAGRFQELQAVLNTLDARLPLVLDLRQCVGGDLTEASQVAGLFAGKVPFLTIQEAGKPERVLEAMGEKKAAFAKVAVLTGFGSIGPAEALAAALKKQSLPTFGERTAAMGVERTRFQLRTGGAAEIVNRRWVGAGGEKLDRQGFLPEFLIRAQRGVKIEEDPLPRILEQLEKKPIPKAEVKPAMHAFKQNFDRGRFDREPRAREIV